MESIMAQNNALRDRLTELNAKIEEMKQVIHHLQDALMGHRDMKPKEEMKL